MDCLEGMVQIADKSIDMILCDLPYGITDCKWDKKINTNKLWEEYNRIIKDNGAIVLTATMKFGIELINGNFKNFRYDLIWHKKAVTGFANAKRMPLRCHELILVFYKKLPTYNPQGLKRLENPKKISRKNNNKENVYKIDTLLKPYKTEFTNYPRSVLQFAYSNNKSLHPTQKPVNMFEYLIKTYTNEGDLVLDNCMGSGTTAVACINTGRNFIGFETDERYFEIANKRITDFI